MGEEGNNLNKSILQEPLGELVAKQLRQSIWNRELQSGERLIEGDLSEKFGVSRNVIRDAFKILEYDELIISIPRKGTYVTELSKKDWREIIELRTMIEAHVFVKVLPLLKEQDFKELEHILEIMKEKAQNQDWSALFDLDVQFHKYIVNLSNNSRIIKIYDSIQVQIRTYMVYIDKYYSSYESFYNEQKELFNVLLTKDSKIVDAHIRKHIEYVEEKLLGEF
ncbi:GntR family transcriptional regulator [Bacillus sp. Sa1BUA2]|uniref:GntR family transcriptional regulator n=1 Tax=Bacillus norwichensis TaxID=2762217 RepID=A0ABR8VRY2_9BACI|nr:GntR family transcriptional regulator [Bacillus norwichensis]